VNLTSRNAFDNGRNAYGSSKNSEMLDISELDARFPRKLINISDKQAPIL